MSSSSHSILAPVVIEPMQRPSANDKSNKMDSILPTSVTKSEPDMLVHRTETGALPAGDAAIGRYQELRAADLKTGSSGVMDWIWKGYIAGGNVTLLTSQWKSGKTTLMSVLLGRLGTGGMMGGHAVSAGRAVVVTEEPKEAWYQRSLKLPLGDHLSWFCRPFLGKASYADWQALLDQIGGIHERRKIAALFIDSLANLGPMRSENEAAEMMKALLPLQRLTSAGMAVVVLHHPKKGPVLPGQMARGSGALSGFVDIIIEMKHVNRRHRNDRRRRLEAYSRHAETPSRWAMEWSADGRDYLSLGPSAAPEFETAWPILQEILEDSEGPMTREEILRHWPEQSPRPGPLTLWRWLDRLIREDQVLSDGDGSKRDPHRYSLPGMELKWQERSMEKMYKQLGMKLREM